MTFFEKCEDHYIKSHKKCEEGGLLKIVNKKKCVRSHLNGPLVNKRGCWAGNAVLLQGLLNYLRRLYFKAKHKPKSKQRLVQSFCKAIGSIKLLFIYLFIYLFISSFEKNAVSYKKKLTALYSEILTTKTSFKSVKNVKNTISIKINGIVQYILTSW